MLSKAMLVPATMFIIGFANAETLCTKTEDVIFSFRASKSRKLISVCKDPNSSYLVYRFGAPHKIDLQFPSQLDSTSWKKFEFAGLRRGGGKENDGFGDYSLSFSNGKAEYVVFQHWNNEDESYSIGINVTVNRQSISLYGEEKTQQGSLTLLEDEAKNIRNIQVE